MDYIEELKNENSVRQNELLRVQKLSKQLKDQNDDQFLQLQDEIKAKNDKV